MSQPWYSTIDDYGIYLLRANVDLAGPAIAVKTARAAGLAGGPVTAVYLAANVLALGALVINDPANLRDSDSTPFRGQDLQSILTSDEFQQLALDLRQARDLMDPPEGIVLNEEGFIEVV